MSRYAVPMMQRTSMPLWHALWDKDVPSAMARNADEQALRAHLVVSIEAKNEKQAARRAEAEHPGFVSIRSAIREDG